MTLNGVIALICIISANSIALQADYATVHGCRQTYSVPVFAKYRLPVTFSTQPSHGLFATAKLLVLTQDIKLNYWVNIRSSLCDFC